MRPAVVLALSLLLPPLLGAQEKGPKPPKIDSLLVTVPAGKAEASDRVVAAFTTAGLTVTNTTTSVIESDLGQTIDQWFGVTYTRVVRAVLLPVTESSTRVQLTGVELRKNGIGQIQRQLRIDNRARGNGGMVWAKMVAVAKALNSPDVAAASAAEVEPSQAPTAVEPRPAPTVPSSAARTDNSQPTGTQPAPAPADTQPKRRYAIGPRHPIRHPKLLAKLMKELVTKHYGTVAKAVKETGISRATWYRLMGGTHGAIPQGLGARLQGLVLFSLGDAGNRRFLAAMTYRGNVPAMERYWAWAFERHHRLWKRRGPFWRRDGNVIASVKGAKERREARRAYANALDKRVEAEVTEFAQFKRWMQLKFIDKDRLMVALMRVLEPFLEAPESGFVEMTWDEAPPASRRQYVRDAVKRERWILEARGPAQQRPDRIATAALGGGVSVEGPSDAV